MTKIIFLTACVKPNGMAYTALNDINTRKQHYIYALQWYLENTSNKIVFVENTNTNLSDGFTKWVIEGRLEFLTFNGNNYGIHLGKGYGEARILQYGLKHSKFLKRDDDVFVKISGRYLCRNITKILDKYDSINTVYANIGKDDWGGNIADSSFVMGPVKFWKDYFLPQKENLNDSKHFHFEHLLYESIYHWKKSGMKHKEFWTLPQMEGVSGTSGLKFVSKKKRDLKSSLLYFLHIVGYRGYLNPFYKGNPYFEIDKFNNNKNM